MISYKGRKVDISKPVMVYRNLNRSGKVYSIKQNNLVVGYTDTISLKDVKLVVNKAGKKRSIETKERNVHAYVKGFITDEKVSGKVLFLKYNPYIAEGFHTIEGEIQESELLTIEKGLIYVKG